MFAHAAASSALGEITLVLFTALAPSGVVALLLMGLPFGLGKCADSERATVDRFMCIPIVVALLGLVASATHLGNPDNALYVLAGVGRSPLSNEVLCGVVFLGAAGVYWLASFAQRVHLGLRRVGFWLLFASGVAFVASIAFAYHAETVVTWSTPLVPVALVLNALTGGPLLALFSLKAAKCAPMGAGYERALVVCALAAGLCGLGVLVAQGSVLWGLENHIVSARELVPGYYGLLACASVLELGGLAAGVVAVWRQAAKPMRLGVACALVFGGMFIMRFAFYMSHMTVGLGF